MMFVIVPIVVAGRPMDGRWLALVTDGKIVFLEECQRDILQFIAMAIFKMLD